MAIAIVGMGGLLPGSTNLAGYWDNILAGRDVGRDVPAGRWPLERASVLHAGGPTPDSVYSLRGYYLNQVPHDPEVDPALDPLFHLAVAISRMAWTDASIRVNRSCVGIVLGSIALPTEQVSRLSREVLEPLSRGISTNPHSFDPRNLDVVGLPAQLVAEKLGFGGLHLTIDAACASSLFALKIACDELHAGRADAMLAGGLNRSDSLYTQMGFSQLRALSPTDRCSPFDARADGLLVGEGGAVFVLRRLEDAERDGDRIAGVIAGIGVSNDVGGSLLAPASEGQLRAMRAAYAQAKWQPSDVDYIECHATGTPVGDSVELASLRELWANGPGRCVLGAVKSTVGHLLTGAGAAGLLKVLLAFQNEVLPPTANFESPGSDSPLRTAPFDVLKAPREWMCRDSRTPRRAAINAFGFGGVNAHVLVEEHQSEKRAAPAFPAPVKIAVVGLGAHFGPWDCRDTFAERVLGGDRRSANADGWRIDEIAVPLDRVRTPPSELNACLPQQLLLLRVAAEALEDAGDTVEPERIGATIGIALDPNTANYDFRWAQPAQDRSRAGPPLTADRVMGSLGSIAASRLARAFDIGGPSFTLSDGPASGMIALKLGTDALQRGELSRVLVGAVDTPGDVRTKLAHPDRTIGEGAAAIVLMRLDDAQRAGKHIYAVIGDETRDAIEVDAASDVGDTGAAASMASIAKACMIADRQRRPAAVSCGLDRVVFNVSAIQRESHPRTHSDAGRTVTIKVRRLPFEAPSMVPSDLPVVVSAPEIADAFATVASAHETFLRFTATTNRQLSGSLALQTAVLERMVATNGFSHSADLPRAKHAFLERPGCLEFAVGCIGPVLGADFAPIDSYPTRVRLPDEPLMLVDRIVSIEGDKFSLTRGRIVTEHDVGADRWYLDNGVAPPSIAIESGQADLFLAAYLGVDFHTKGRAVYRLLDAAVTFYRGLPRTGETVRYDIRIREFFRQGDMLLFRFEFDGSIAGEPLLSMRDGCAGFFTPAELAAGRGVAQTEMQRRPQPGKAPVGWKAPAPLNGIESYSSEQLDALRSGDLAACFGPEFAALDLRKLLTLPLTSELRLIHRVTHFDPAGGRFGLGLIRAEADIHPDDWFLTCHFVDDQVMPGTLMYECCLHTLRVAFLRMGWIGEADAVAFQPVTGVTSRLKCRGQVTAATRTVAYEVAIKELGYGPEPFAIADALMYADGKAIVEVRDMTLRVGGLTLRELTALWSDKSTTIERDRDGRTAPVSVALDSRQTPNIIFDRAQVTEFATGSPSRAFGDRYAPFDHNRFIARLPTPPYSFLDRIVSATVKQWQMNAGGSAVAEYDIPPDAWYFTAARQPRMPYTVLLEAALQACGWVSAYIGSALQSDVDLHYRNLGGRATAFHTVGPNAGPLSTTVKFTKVSKSAGMIIQHFDFAVRDAAGRDVFVGDTYFGFFTGEALGQQVGLREAQPYLPGADEIRMGEQFEYPNEPPFPDSMLRMIDRVELFAPAGGPHGLGFIRGTKVVDPTEWFFKAHFHQDPVWPGSLGLEAFLQLLQVTAARRWGPPAAWEPIGLGHTHKWTYRGQVTPGDRLVTVQAEMTRIEDAAHTLLADGWLLVDGRVIYQIQDFAFRHTT